MALWDTNNNPGSALHGRGPNSQRYEQNTQDLTGQPQSKERQKLTCQHLAKILIMPISLDGKVCNPTQTVRKIHIKKFVLLNKIIAG